METMVSVALCQMRVQADKEDNLRTAREMVTEAALQGARLVVLPEMFNTPYTVGAFGAFAEGEGGPTCRMLSDLARDNRIVLVGGSIPERDGDRVYNTSFVYGPDGERIARHRKRYLFDVDIGDGVSFRESRVLSPGEGPTLFSAFGRTFGLAICFEIRFPEYIQELRAGGAEALVIPASFTQVTGRAHWEILGRARAVDTQCWLVLVSAADHPEAVFRCHGHSMVVDPWGCIQEEANGGDVLLFGVLDFDQVFSVRRRLPLLAARGSCSKV